MKKYLLTLPLLLSLFGCGLFEMEQIVEINLKPDITTQQTTIIESLKNANIKDCETIYKVFAGASLYIENSSHLNKWSDVLILINRVEGDYKWTTDKYSKLTDIIEADLKSNGYEEDKEFDKETRDNVSKMFNGYAEAVKIALKDKNAKR